MPCTYSTDEWRHAVGAWLGRPSDPQAANVCLIKAIRQAHRDLFRDGHEVAAAIEAAAAQYYGRFTADEFIRAGKLYRGHRAGRSITVGEDELLVVGDGGNYVFERLAIPAYTADQWSYAFEQAADNDWCPIDTAERTGDESVRAFALAVIDIRDHFDGDDDIAWAAVMAHGSRYGDEWSIPAMRALAHGFQRLLFGDEEDEDPCPATEFTHAEGKIRYVFAKIPALEEMRKRPAS